MERKTSKAGLRASLVASGIGITCQRRGGVQFLIRKIPRVTEQLSRVPWARPPQQERPPHGEAAHHQREYPHSIQQEKSPAGNQDQHHKVKK